MIYQQMIYESHNFYLKTLFLEKGINVFTWNYRGYGRSQGTPDPDLLRSDIMEVFHYLKNTLNVKG